MLPSDLVLITNTLNEGVLCRGNAKWWEQLGATEEEISEVLMGRRDIQIRYIHTSSLMVMFCPMTKRRINPIRLILDYMLLAIDAARRSHAALSYGILLTQVFMRAQLPVDGHKKDDKCPITTQKTFSAMGLKPQGLEKKEKKKKKKEEKKKDPKKTFSAIIIIFFLSTG